MQLEIRNGFKAKMTGNGPALRTCQTLMHENAPRDTIIGLLGQTTQRLRHLHGWYFRRLTIILVHLPHFESNGVSQLKRMV